jgi:hypothetical protein
VEGTPLFIFGLKLPIRIPAILPYAAAALLSLSVLSGCQYSIRGIVMAGKTADILVVDSDDPRLKEIGLDRVRIEGILDPVSMRPKKLRSSASDDLGRFNLPIDASGAGFLEYEIHLLFRRTGFRPSQTIMALPSKDKRLIIIMAQGHDVYRGNPSSNEADQLRNQAEQLNK